MKKILKFKTPDLKKIKDQNVIATAVLIQAIKRAEQAEYNYNFLKWEYKGRIKMSNQYFAKAQRIVEKYDRLVKTCNKLVDKNKQLIKKLEEKEKCIQKLLKPKKKNLFRRVVNG